MAEKIVPDSRQDKMLSMVRVSGEFDQMQYLRKVIFELLPIFFSNGGP